MKKLFNGIMGMLLVAGMFAVGCQEYSIDSQPEAAPALQDDAMESYIMAAEAASAVVFNISSNTPWRIERDAEWVTVTPSMSAVSSLVSEVKVSVTDNVTATPRTATLTIMAPDAAFEKTVTIYQASKGEILVTESTTDIDAEGGDVEFRIYTNKAWEYLPISNELVNAASLEGAAAGTAAAADADDVLTYVLHIAVPSNTGVKRTLAFMIKTATGNIERTINQKGVTLELGQEEEPLFDSYGAGSEVTFLVKANVAGWKADVADEDKDWLEVVSWDSTAANGGTVTVKTKGDINPYLQARRGTVNLTYEDATGIVYVYQPVAFDINNLWKGAMINNDDMSVTIKLDNNIETRIFTSVETLGGYGTVTFEFDYENSNLVEGHGYIILSTNGEEGGDYWRSAFTPHVVANYGAGIYNNFVQKNGNFANGRWNFDGVGVNGTPTSTNPDEIMPFADVKKLEKITYTFTASGLTCTYYANGLVYSRELAVAAAAKTQYDALVSNLKVSFRTIKAAAGSHGHAGGYTGEYITFKKVYFTPAE